MSTRLKAVIEYAMREGILLSKASQRQFNDISEEITLAKSWNSDHLFVTTSGNCVKLTMMENYNEHNKAST